MSKDINCLWSRRWWIAAAALGILVIGVVISIHKANPAGPWSQATAWSSWTRVDAGHIVIGEQSGTVYVVAGNPKKLIPTFNLASARLL